MRYFEVAAKASAPKRKASLSARIHLLGLILRFVFGFHGFLSERKFSIHKAPLETYMSNVCV